MVQASQNTKDVNSTNSTNLTSTDTRNIDPLLLVNKPAIVRSKGRPIGSLNKRREKEENPTRRDPSAFEHINNVLDTERGRGRGGRRRGGGRGSRGGPYNSSGLGGTQDSNVGQGAAAGGAT
ncbi:MAG: hypothetical protein L6R37_008436, partial [Teloschistes peruensis]